MRAIKETMETENGGAPAMLQFEREFSAHAQHRSALAVKTPAEAVRVALQAIGLQPGAGVLVSAIASPHIAEAVRDLGAIPIPVDSHGDDYNLDVWDAEHRLSKAQAEGLRVKALLPTHFAGQIGDVAGIRNLSLKYGLKVIEDAAHCRPSFYRESAEDAWKRPGRHADVTCYSFQREPGPGGMEGGTVCTDQDELAERLRMIRMEGLLCRWTGSREGDCAQGDELTASELAGARQRLQQADRQQMLRSQLASTYEESLGLAEELVLPGVHPDRIHSWQMYVLRLRQGTLDINRDQVLELLTAAGIDAAFPFSPPHPEPGLPARHPEHTEDWPVAARVYPELLSLPIEAEFPAEQAEYVGRRLMSIITAHRKKVPISLVQA